MPADVVLTRLWLNSLADPEDLIALRISRFAPAKTVRGAFEENAGGRIRLITRAGQPKAMVATCVRPTAEERAWLDEHVGLPGVTVRDPDGGKFAGAYLLLGYERSATMATDVTLTISEFTASEVV